ncbi:hypothetical protein BXZ70DRAFT_525827 [Cristinia sonorae]|uniref:Uncharacterized protein n=1 Tax=Cristinia sonorae TaxID=1940300 RepID=A0A8K0XTJ4_9AGAR|nr:hypothetical protein BXZ70DRAFT_525827 [Cristinia sonorae]
MPILASAPPGSEAVKLNDHQPMRRTTAAVVQDLAQPQKPEIEHQTLQQLAIPAVRLDVDEISSAMAARLTASLVSHVLFLKSQIPFPVVQLSRMPGSKADSRSAKKKLDLVNTIDLLSSHLHTTFRALSTAFAASQMNGQKGQTARPLQKAQAHMAVVLGPTVGTSKAKVLLVMSGLEVKHAGVASGSKTAKTLPPTVADKSDEGDQEDHEANDDTDEDDVPDSDSEDTEDEGDSEYSDEDGSDQEPGSSDESPATPPRSGSSRSVSPSSETAEPPSATFLEEQQILRTADRLLSRTLASACAEPDGGLSSELAPTQTHILLRAPRRFSHPEWTPRQNFTRSLDKTLSEYLAAAIKDPASSAPKPSKPSYTVGSRTEGVWIGSRGERLQPKLDHPSEETEEDDMIWWTWNSKIVGFSDW